MRHNLAERSLPTERQDADSQTDTVYPPAVAQAISMLESLLFEGYTVNHLCVTLARGTNLTEIKLSEVSPPPKDREYP